MRELVRRVTTTLVLFCALVLLALPVSASQRYASPAGDDAGGLNDCLVQGSPCTLGFALSTAVAGDTVNAAAGTYAGNFAITKSITLSGPNAGIDPNTGSRVAEAILVPGATQTSLQG